MECLKRGRAVNSKRASTDANSALNGSLAPLSATRRRLLILLPHAHEAPMAERPGGQEGLARSFDERPSVFSVVHPT
jgi:hypothetical protein